jgi:hypothetical protein
VGKLLSLKVGESMMLDDTAADIGPTRLERDLQTQLARSKALVGRAFTGQRVSWINGDRLSKAYRITRTE